MSFIIISTSLPYGLLKIPATCIGIVIEKLY